MQHILGINRRNVDLIKPHVSRDILITVDDKLKTKEILQEMGISFAQVYGECRNFFEINSFLKTVNSGSSCVLKPSRGFGGNGIEVVKEIRDGQWRLSGGRLWGREDQEEYVRNVLYGVYSMGDGQDTIFAEQLLIPHDAIAPFATDGLPDVRIILYKGKAVAAMMRVATKKSQGKANLHAGGFALAIDCETGITGNGWNGKRIHEHPESGIALAGHELPMWNDIIEQSERLYERFPLVYMGIDFTIDGILGPVVLELNARPGLEIQNVLGRGLREIIGEDLNA